MWLLPLDQPLHIVEHHACSRREIQRGSPVHETPPARTTRVRSVNGCERSIPSCGATTSAAAGTRHRPVRLRSRQLPERHTALGLSQQITLDTEHVMRRTALSVQRAECGPHMGPPLSRDHVMPPAGHRHFIGRREGLQVFGRDQMPGPDIDQPGTCRVTARKSGVCLRHFSAERNRIRRGCASTSTRSPAKSRATRN